MDQKLSALSCAKVFRCGKHTFPLGKRTYVVGILNVTPDSFSDGGSFFSTQAALNQAARLIDAGADLIDIGGESTRPQASPVGAQEEMRRILPVIRALAQTGDTVLSVDTYKPAVAQAALEAGASVINDTMGLHQKGDMARVAARYGAGLIVMYNARIDPAPPGQQKPDLLDHMIRFFQRSLDRAQAAQLSADRIILDPGIGFGVSTAQSIRMIQELACFEQLGYPLLVGPSRKRFIGESLPDGQPDRLMGTAAAVAISIARGADFVRVHDVSALMDLVRMTDVLCRKGGD